MPPALIIVSTVVGDAAGAGGDYVIAVLRADFKQTYALSGGSNCTRNVGKVCRFARAHYNGHAVQVGIGANEKRGNAVLKLLEYYNYGVAAAE